jgi:hypothetical protein
VQTHIQLGGGIKALYQSRQGLNLGAVGRLVRGTPRSYDCRDRDHCESESQTDMSPYTLVSGGMMVGFDFEGMGAEGGVNIVHLSDGPTGAIPWARLKVGPTQTGWFETTFGPQDPLFVVDLFSLGAGWSTETLGGRAGVMGYGVLLEDVEDRGDLSLGTGSDELIDLGAYLDLVYALPGTQIAITAGGFVGHSLGARLGLAGVFSD